MQTLVPLPKPKAERRRFGERITGLVEPKKQRETLDQAKRRLIEIQRRATAAGIEFPPPERPTLSKVKDEIGVLEQQLAALLAPKANTIAVTPAASTQSTPAATANITARARAFLAKAATLSPSRPAAPTKSQAPEDMSRSELIAAIDREPDRQKIGSLFGEL